MIAATTTETAAPPTLREPAPLPGAGVPVPEGDGAFTGSDVLLSAFATFWKAAKLRPEVSSELIANTIPEPQWLP